MAFVNVLVTMVRRWYITLPVAAVCVAISVSVWSTSDVRYVARLPLVTVGAVDVDLDDVGDDEIVNPLADLDQSTRAVAQIVTTVVDSDAVRAELAAQGAAPDYLLAVITGQTPLVEIQVVSDRRAVSARTVELVAERLVNELAARQEQLGVSVDERLTVEPLGRGSIIARRRQADRLRFFGAAFLLTAAATVVAPAWFDARRREQERSRRDDAPVQTVAVGVGAAGESDDTGGPAEPDPEPTASTEHEAFRP